EARNIRGNAPKKWSSFMANLFEMKQDRAALLAKCDSIVAAAERGNRQLTSVERCALEDANNEVQVLNAKIVGIQSKNSIQQMGFNAQGYNSDAGAAGVSGAPRGFSKPQQMVLSPGYAAEFFRYISSSGREVGAALYESGGGPSGGYAVPSVVDDQIVPLAPQEMAIRQLATVLPTVSDVKFPIKASFGTAALKAETVAFAGSPLTLGQFTLSAFMIGAQNDVSWELAQDV